MKEIYYFSMSDRPKKFSGVTEEYWEEIPQEILLVMKWSIDYFCDPVYMLFIEQRSARKNSNMVGECPLRKQYHVCQYLFVISGLQPHKLVSVFKTYLERSVHQTNKFNSN